MEMRKKEKKGADENRWRNVGEKTAKLKRRGVKYDEKHEQNGDNESQVKNVMWFLFS